MKLFSSHFFWTLDLSLWYKTNLIKDSWYKYLCRTIFIPIFFFDSSGGVKDNEGNTYEFSVCSDLKGMANVSLAQTNQTTKAQTPLGYNNRTLVASDSEYCRICYLHIRYYSIAYLFFCFQSWTFLNLLNIIIVFCFYPDRGRNSYCSFPSLWIIMSQPGNAIFNHAVFIFLGLWLA